MMVLGDADKVCTLEQLAEFFGLTPRRVRQLLDDGHVVRAGDKKNFEFLPSVKGYIAYLQQAAQGKAVGDEAKEKQAAQVGLLQSQLEHSRIKLDVQRRELVPADEFRSICVRLVKILSEGSDSLPDQLERSVGLSGEVADALRAAIDAWRMRLYEAAVEAFGGQGPANDLLQPIVVLPEKQNSKMPLPDLVQADAGKPKRGRPRKIKADAFTPDLL